MLAAAGTLPSAGQVALMLFINAALFCTIALLFWGAEALWNRVFFPKRVPTAFPPHGRLSARAALAFTGRHAGWIIGLVFALTMALTSLADALGIELPKQELIIWLTSPDFPVSAKVAIIVFAVLQAPLVEELIFRRFLFRALLRGTGKVLPAFVLSGLAFGLVHGNLAAFLPISVLGGLFAWVYYRTGRIWTSMLCHASFNAISVVLALLFPELA